MESCSSSVPEKACVMLLTSRRSQFPEGCELCPFGKAAPEGDEVKVTWDVVISSRDECREKHTGCCWQMCAEAPRGSDGTVLSCAAVCAGAGLRCCVMDVEGMSVSCLFPPSTSLLRLAMKHLWCWGPGQPNQLLAVHCQDLCGKVF